MGESNTSLAAESADETPNLELNSIEGNCPDYLRETYWWAYLHPRAVRFFERQWLVSLILWGNYRRLSDAVLADLKTWNTRRLLQTACAYGDLTPRVLANLGKDAHLTVVDVAAIQLENLRTKLYISAQDAVLQDNSANVRLHREDSSKLSFEDGSFDTNLLFFLLHEQPMQVRLQTISEAVRVTRSGGRILIVDYHRPVRGNPVGWLMRPLLRRLEPFALDLWDADIGDWLPQDSARVISHQTYFGGLYQKLIIERL